MEIYSSTRYINNPSIGDLKLKVNSMWEFGARDICFSRVNDSVIGYDLLECTEVTDGIIVGGTEKVKNTKWKQAEVTPEIIEELEKDGYNISKLLKNKSDE